MLFRRLYLSTLVFVTSLMHIKADLKTDLKSFLPLLPRSRIGFLVAQHYIGDANFREAWHYLHEPQFAVTWQGLLQTKDMSELLEYVSHSVDLHTFLYNLPHELRSYHIAMRLPPEEAMTQRNLASFLRDLLRTLPRGAITVQITRKLRENGDFAKLYNVLRNNEFKIFVDKVRHAETVQPAIREFARHAIDVDEVIKTGFILLSWGP